MGMYEEHLPLLISEEGIRLTPAFIEFLLPEEDEKERGLAIISVEPTEIEAVTAFTAELLKIKEERKISEFIFALDVHIRAGAADSLDSALVIFNGRRGKKPRKGMLQYSWNNGDPITKKTVWDGEFVPTKESSGTALKLSEALFETAFS